MKLIKTLLSVLYFFKSIRYLLFPSKESKSLDRSAVKYGERQCVSPAGVLPVLFQVAKGKEQSVSLKLQSQIDNLGV